LTVAGDEAETVETPAFVEDPLEQQGSLDKVMEFEGSLSEVG
jgi:hypothetical protein